MRVLIYTDEYYPFFNLTNSMMFAKPCDIDAATVKRWKRVMKQFRQVQEEMEAALNDSYSTRVGYRT